jgi:hypothetical protein
MEDKIIEYLKSERDILREKKLTGFWILCDTDAFKPIKGLSETKVKEILLSDPEKYGNRKIASIDIVFNPSKKAIKTKDILISFVIVVMKIGSKGELKSTNQKNLRINYNIDDLNIRKFKMKDIRKFLKLCKEGLLNSETLNGISLEYAIEKLQKKNINLDDIEV